MFQVNPRFKKITFFTYFILRHFIIDVFSALTHFIQVYLIEFVNIIKKIIDWLSYKN